MTALALLTGGVVAAITRHEARPASEPVATRVPKSTTAAAMTRFPVDVQTMQQRPLTREEAQQMADALKQMANQSTDGLVQVRQGDGTVSMDLDGRFQNVVLAKKNADGTVEQACVDNPTSGAAFLGIDPALVGDKANNKAAAVKPANPIQ